MQLHGKFIEGVKQFIDKALQDFIKQALEPEIGVRLHSAQQLCSAWVERRHMQDDVIDTSAFANAAESLWRMVGK